MPFLLLYSFFLQALHPAAASPTQAADIRYADWAIRLLPLAISLYVLFSGRSREDRKAHDLQLKELILAKENHQERMKGLQLELERVADEMLRRHEDHEKKLNEVSKMREDMAGMKAKLEGYGESINEIKSMLREIQSALRKP